MQMLWKNSEENWENRIKGKPHSANATTAASAPINAPADRPASTRPAALVDCAAAALVPDALLPPLLLPPVAVAPLAAVVVRVSSEEGTDMVLLRVTLEPEA